MSTESEPKRIQLRRTKGWRKPEGAVVVARPTRWGNPYRVGDTHETMHWVRGEMEPYTIRDRAAATSAFRESIGVRSTFWNDVQAQLRGKDLACWCPLDQPCHADVLLEIANRDTQ